MISIGLSMFMRPVCGSCGIFKKESKFLNFLLRRLTFSSNIHLFVMGMAFAAVPCLPMTAALLYSSRMPSMISSSILMMLFGIGTAVSPLVIISLLAGLFSKKIRTAMPQYEVLFRKTAGLVLILLGIFPVVF